MVVGNEGQRNGTIYRPTAIIFFTLQFQQFGRCVKLCYIGVVLGHGFVNICLKSITSITVGVYAFNFSVIKNITMALPSLLPKTVKEEQALRILTQIGIDDLR